MRPKKIKMRSEATKKNVTQLMIDGTGDIRNILITVGEGIQ